MDQEEYRRMAAAADGHWWYRATRQLLRDLLADRLPGDDDPNTVLLDAGAGTGATGGWLTEHGVTVFGDVEREALAVAQARVRGGLPTQLTVERLPFADDSFAAVLCVTVLYHRLVVDPAAAVREFARVVRPGGTVVLMEPGGRRLSRAHDVVTHGARRFARGELRRAAEDAGLLVERATGAYSFLVPPAAVLARLGGRRGPAGSDLDRTNRAAGVLLGLLARAERFLLRRTDLPVGLSVIVVARKPSVRR